LKLSTKTVPVLHALTKEKDKKHAYEMFPIILKILEEDIDDIQWQIDSHAWLASAGIADELHRDLDAIIAELLEVQPLASPELISYLLEMVRLKIEFNVLTTKSGDYLK